MGMVDVVMIVLGIGNNFHSGGSGDSSGLR